MQAQALLFRRFQTYHVPRTWSADKNQLFLTGSWIPDRLAPGCAAGGRIVPPRITCIRAVHVAFAFGVGVAVFEAPIHQAGRWILRDRRSENGSVLVVHDIPITQVRCLRRSLPGQDAVCISRGEPVGVACWDAIGLSSQADDDTASGAASLGAGDRHSDCGRHGVVGCRVAAANELEAISSGDPIARMDEQIPLHAGGANGEGFPGRRRAAGKC